MKIEAAAGYDVDQYIKDMGEELRQCDDVGVHPRAKQICDLVAESVSGVCPTNSSKATQQPFLDR